MTAGDATDLFTGAGLSEERSAVERIDPHRSNHFYSLVPSK